MILLNTIRGVLGKLEAPCVRIYDLARAPGHLQILPGRQGLDLQIYNLSITLEDPSYHGRALGYHTAWSAKGHCSGPAGHPVPQTQGKRTLTSITIDISNNSENQENPARRNYIKWDDSSAEKILDGEAEDYSGSG